MLFFCCQSLKKNSFFLNDGRRIERWVDILKGRGWGCFQSVGKK